MNIKSVSKGIAGGLAAALVAWLVNNGVILEPEFSEALKVVLAAVIGFIGVYIAPKNA